MAIDDALKGVHFKSAIKKNYIPFWGEVKCGFYKIFFLFFAWLTVYFKNVLNSWGQSLAKVKGTLIELWRSLINRSDDYPLGTL